MALFGCALLTVQGMLYTLTCGLGPFLGTRSSELPYLSQPALVFLSWCQLDHVSDQAIISFLSLIPNGHIYVTPLTLGPLPPSLSSVLLKNLMSRLQQALISFS